MDVSSSVSAITDSDLKDAEINSITELSQHVPNLHIFTWGGSRENNILFGVLVRAYSPIQPWDLC